MKILVGYTGFVGSNIYEKTEFDGVFNSKNIEKAYGLEPDLLIYAGLRAEKFLANSNPLKDMELIEEAKHNISMIKPRQLVLISTIDVYKEPVLVDEDSAIVTDGLHPYGLNRYLLECWVRENYSNALIIRLPGLFGKNIKKNFIYDYINVIPSMLKGEKFLELKSQEPVLEEYYTLLDNGFYKCRSLEEADRDLLKKLFKKIGFTALNFTDSRNFYQFYPLSRLWEDITLALSLKVTLLNLATQPISVGELYASLTGNEFVNHLSGGTMSYDYRTLHADAFGGSSGYILDKQSILLQIKEFIDENC